MANDQVHRVFERIKAKLQPTLQRLPDILGNDAVNYSLEAFEKASWEGVPWQERKSKKDAGRQILVKSGAGRRGIKYVVLNGNSVRLSSTVPYMAVHNNGGRIERAARSETFTRNRYQRGPNKGRFKKGTNEGRGFSFGAYGYNMPKRQFMGKTKRLVERLKATAAKEIQNALKA